MRKVLMSLTVAASALAVAAPASAQIYVQYVPQGYAQPHYAPGYAPGYANQNYAFGWGQNYNRYGHVRALQARVDQLQREIGRLAQYRMISRNEFHNLQRDAREIERNLRRNARDGRGLTMQEMYGTDRRIARLEAKIARDVRDGRRYGYRW